MRFFALVASTAVAVTPVQKVIQLLEDMVHQGVQEKKDEAVRFSKFSQWCEDTEAHKKQHIADADLELESLAATSAKAASDIAQLSAAIEEEQQNIATWDKDQKAATEVRNKEHADYQATDLDFGESVDALKRAIRTLKEQNYDRKQAEELLQVTASTTTRLAVALATHLKQPANQSEYMDRRAPEANGYEFQSGGIIEMLEGLKDKFTAEKKQLNQEETSARHAYEMLIQDLSDRIEDSEDIIHRREQTRSERRETKARADAEHADTSADRAEDAKYLSDLQAECQTKHAAFEQRTQLRGEELDAIRKAIDILGSDDVSGAADRNLPSLVQVKRVFGQLRSSSVRDVRVQKAIDFLASQGASMKSQAITLFAQSAQRDPFDKVRKMIREMIFSLKKEATEEAEHEGWCQTELGKNKVTREHKQQSVDELTATSEKLNADIARLTQEISDLQTAIADLDASVAEATANRKEEREKNKVAIQEAKDAQEAVGRALVVLREFYAKAAEAQSFIQQTPAEDAPETFDNVYQGLQGENGGVVGMLEVITSDFARLESETTAAEAQADKAFKEFVNDSQVDKAVKGKDVEHKTERKASNTQELARTEEELKTTTEELNAANDYYDKLKPECVNPPVSYEERVAKREEEIQSLKEALGILEGTEI